MTVFVSDTFTEASNTALESHTPDTGGAWSKYNDVDGATVNAAGDYVTGDNASSTSVYINAATPGGAEYDVEADFVVASSSSFSGIAGRMVAAGNEGYWTYHNLGIITLQRIVAGSPTDLGNYSIGTLTTTWSEKLEIRDAAKKVFIDGVERISSANNDTTAAGKAGLRLRPDGRIDNFVATDTTSGTVTGTGAGTLPSLTGAASGTPIITGTGAGTLPSLTGAATGSPIVTGTGAGTLPSLTGSASNDSTVTGTGAGTLPSLTGAASGSPVVTGTGAGTLPSLSGAATGSPVVTGIAAAVLPSLSGSAAGSPIVTGTGAGTLPSLTGSGTNIVPVVLPPTRGTYTKGEAVRAAFTGSHGGPTTYTKGSTAPASYSGGNS